LVSHSAADHAREQLGPQRAADLSTQGAALSIAGAVALGLAIAGMGEASAQAHGDRDEQRLTERELEVLRLLADGHSNREIAEQLVLSTRTVERHIENVYAKIGVNGRAAATAYAVRQQLVG
jgi:DNA-binding NarL/FixJ family response regulator